MTVVIAVWEFLRRLPWRFIGITLAVIALLTAIYGLGHSNGRHSRDGEVAGLNTTIANMRAASAEAARLNAEHVLEVEARDTQIQKEQTDALDHQIASLRTAAADYARLHAYFQAKPGDARAGGVSQAARPTGPVAGASPEALVPASDLDACAVAYGVATGWKDWWAEVSAAPR